MDGWMNRQIMYEAQNQTHWNYYKHRLMYNHLNMLAVSFYQLNKETGVKSSKAY